MRYKDYLFPHNPASIRISAQAALAMAQCPGHAPAVQHMGRGRRVITGSGSFFGEDALEQYRRLEAVFRQKSSGLLQLPGLHSVMAYFARLECDAKGDGSVIEYSFEFWEAALEQEV